jgi:plasmid rolling circle replication initiator protein Rep
MYFKVIICGGKITFKFIDKNIQQENNKNRWDYNYLSNNTVKPV